MRVIQYLQTIDKETEQLIKRIEQAVRAAKLRRFEPGEKLAAQLILRGVGALSKRCGKPAIMPTKVSICSWEVEY